MTIVSDIAQAIQSAEQPPTGLVLGWSGWHAFGADMAYIRDRGDQHQRAQLKLVQTLPFTRTEAFDGWDLAYGRPRAGRKVA